MDSTDKNCGMSKLILQNQSCFGDRFICVCMVKLCGFNAEKKHDPLQIVSIPQFMHYSCQPCQTNYCWQIKIFNIPQKYYIQIL